MFPNILRRQASWICYSTPTNLFLSLIRFAGNIRTTWNLRAFMNDISASTHPTFCQKRFVLIRYLLFSEQTCVQLIFIDAFSGLAEEAVKGRPKELGHGPWWKVGLMRENEDHE